MLVSGALLLLGDVVLAQTEAESVPDSAVIAAARDDAPAWHDMFTRVPGDWKRFATNTFQLETLHAAAGLAGITAAFLVADDVLWRRTNDFSNRNETTKDITHAFAEMGDGKFVLGLAGGFALVGWSTNDNRALRVASQMVQSYLACGITVQVLKHVTGRERPERQSRPRGKWRPLPNQIDYHRAIPKYDAFPSGHTAAAMAMVTVLIENYPEAQWLKPVGYTAVGLVAFSLVCRGWHWYSDFPLAIALGYQYGRLAAHPETASSGPQKLSVLPALMPEGAGIRLAYSF